MKELLLYGEIGKQINGNEFATALAEAKKEGNPITIKINSSGGRVDQGLSIVSEIINSNVEIITYVTGLAASMAGVIALSGTKVMMNDFARIMVHNVTGGGNDAKSKAVRAELNVMLNDIMTRRGFDKEKMEKLMNVESWIGANEANMWGLIDQIEETKITQKAENIIRQNKPAEELVNELMNVIDKSETGIKTLGNINNFTNNKNSIIMESILNALNARDEQSGYQAVIDIQNEVKALKEEKNSLETDKTAKEAEIEKLQNTINETQKAVLEGYVNDAIEKGKFKKEAKEILLKQYENNAEEFKAVVNAMPEMHNQKIDNFMQGFENNLSAEDLKKKKAEKYEELTKDSRKAKSFQNNNPELFEQLYNAYCEIN